MVRRSLFALAIAVVINGAFLALDGRGSTPTAARSHESLIPFPGNSFHRLPAPADTARLAF